ncbi:hypothetical protein POVWA2_058600 [Plasmodium ovale wallikeri]|uniref:Uncharacterized protein n=1 Tax=Plasmodium ovale wallikeri TaxID=864142 RepID=A0A1A9A0E5_PLAOA|nr:hypothetical protein POVWA2_058600 [Plasmodium ovale wallikeri]
MATANEAEIMRLANASSKHPDYFGGSISHMGKFDPSPPKKKEKIEHMDIRIYASIQRLHHTKLERKKINHIHSPKIKKKKKKKKKSSNWFFFFLRPVNTSHEIILFFFFFSLYGCAPIGSSKLRLAGCYLREEVTSGKKLLKGRSYFREEVTSGKKLLQGRSYLREYCCPVTYSYPPPLSNRLGCGRMLMLKVTLSTWQPGGDCVT